MDFRESAWGRGLSAVVLFFFCWTFAGGAELAHAAAGPENSQGAAHSRAKGAASVLDDVLKDAEDALADTSLTAREKQSRAKAALVALDDADAALRAEFEATGKRITEKRLPDAIAKRHDAFVKDYETRYGELRSRIDKVGKAKDSEIEAAVADALDEVKKARPERKRAKLDPTKLPHRALEEKSAPTEDWTPPVSPRASSVNPLVERYPLAADYEPYAVGAEHVLVASTGSLSGLLDGSSVTSSTPPSDEDLAETVEVQFTDAILAKAGELANTPQAQGGALPIAIYEWVRNNVEYAPTWGSIQGADYCLQTMKCNSFDTASLLVALFRANGIHARYATVTGEMKVDRFMNWMGGFTNATAALDYAATGGMPMTGLVEGGQVKYVRFEQVVVEGWVDMTPSLGAKHVEGDYWIRFDPSFKEYTYAEGMDISSAVPFDYDGLMASLANSATINVAEGYITGLDMSLVEDAVQAYKTQRATYIINTPDIGIEDIVPSETIVKHEFPILMGTLPYKTKQVHARYRELPESLRHTLTFAVEADDMYYGTEPLSITYALPELAGRKVTLSYSPATTEDEAVINSYLPSPHEDGTPIDPSELPTSLPAYLINLKPELRIDGEVVATGGSITMGAQEQVDMTFHDPVRGDDIVSNVIEAGEYWGIAVDVAGEAIKTFELAAERAEATGLKLQTKDYSSINRDESVGEMLYFTALLLNGRMNGYDTVLADSLNVRAVRFPSEAIFKTSLSVETSYGVPVAAGYDRLMMDVDRNLSMVKALDGNANSKYTFVLQSGINLSSFEHSVPEEVWTSDTTLVEAVSAVKAIMLANESGIPIYTINSGNVESIMPNLDLDADVFGEIRNAVNAGKEVIVPQSEITVGTWTGCGYVVLDPVTGEGAYMISGGESGGAVDLTRANSMCVSAIFTLNAFGQASLSDGCFDAYYAFEQYAAKEVGLGRTWGVDWCGTNSSKEAPDYPFGIDAVDACENHDYCYTEAENVAEKLLCDFSLGSDLLIDCIAQGNNVALCGLVSDTYKAVVIVAGWGYGKHND